MNKSFSVIISDLRKERHLNQKDAAKHLGISQALLSHYEKGIRECSREFLIKAADFYGVSCDYLLGRTDERKGETGFDIHKRIDGDDEFSTETLMRTCFAIKESLDENDNSQLNLLFATELYRFILLAANCGCLPAEWGLQGEKPFSREWINYVSSVADELSASTYGFSDSASRKTAPPCVETTVDKVLKYLQGNIKKSIPIK